jgi:hypothetical protein
MNLLLLIIPAISLLLVCSITIGVLIWLNYKPKDGTGTGTGTGIGIGTGIGTGTGTGTGTGADIDIELYKKFPESQNIVGLYTLDSFDTITGVWKDMSPSGNDLTVVNGKVDGYYVTGTTESTITFPETILPPEYTFGYIAKYNGPTKKRIFTSKKSNWLSGFWNESSGVAHHHKWITNQKNTFDNTQDLIGTSTNNSFRANKNPVTLDTIADTPLLESADLNVNDGKFQNKSDWAIKVMVIYNKQIQDDNKRIMEYLLPFSPKFLVE